ncbi:LPP20 lipoprotein [Breznakibacter xylanolyticus]|uniref:LPP20 lipoprotein n=1 Tax=Breznakibacter xylanolyticus TaxID=990 RepID=A0A2W7NJ59_9BACT|nr:LPP20 family lipoprotein [Breznakibacter xylanolyticus]PZX16744.1 LPP20 lipoprotein [Breznakibacter xylanolyticus]
MRNLSIATLLTMLLLALTAQAARKPSWVKQRPSDSNAYIGIGMAMKKPNDLQHATQARNQALRELSAEIQVTISANSILRQFENNYELKESFESNVQTSVAQTLEGYEVTTWEDKTQYWVMLKLDKDKYELNRHMTLDKARRTAWSSIEAARSATERNNIRTAISHYIGALQAIEKHLQDDLTIKTFDGSINIGTTLYQDIQQLLKQILITPEHTTYTLAFTQQLRQPIKIRAHFGAKADTLRAIHGLPIIFELTRNGGDITNRASTEADGSTTCFINQLSSKRRVQELQIRLDMESLLQNSIQNQSLTNIFFHASAVPQTMVILELNKVKAWFNQSEEVFGGTYHAAFNNQIKSLLSDSYFIFTTHPEDAEYVVFLQTQFIKGDEKIGTGYSVFVVYGSYRITISNNANRTEIFADTIDRIIGMQPGNYDYALKNCRDKLKDQFLQHTLPKLDSVDM